MLVLLLDFDLLISSNQLEWQIRSKLDSKKPGTQPEKMTNSEDLTRKVPNLARQGATSNSKRN
jgi:hypothetical protein